MKASADALPRFGMHTTAVLMLLGVAGIPSAQAQGVWHPHVAVRKAGTLGEVQVNAVPVIRFRKPFAGLSPGERSQVAADRLRDALLLGATAASVRVDAESDPDAPHVTIDGMTIATAPTASIPDKGSRRRRLRLQKVARADAKNQAEDWAHGLKRALALPGLTIGNASPLVPVGEARRVRLGGPARGPVQVILPDDGVTSPVKATVSGDVVTLSGLKPGHETLLLEREGATHRLSVTVRPYAGTLDAPHPVTVTGPTTPASLIAKLARVAAAQAVKPLPGAAFRLASAPLSVPSLRSGRGTTIAVPVRIFGPEMLPVERRILVPVVNAHLSPVPTSTLFYSNNPERVSASQTLFSARLPGPEQATRLLYHHQSVSDHNLQFIAELVNDTDGYTRVHFVGGDAGPERDTVWVGYRAASDYLKAQEVNRGVVVELPPFSRVPLSSLRLPPNLTVSGLMQLRLLSGTAPLVRIAVENDPDLRTTLVPITLPRDPARLAQFAPTRASDHVYPNPTKRLDAVYTVGGPWTFVRFGKVPLKAVQTASAKGGVETLLYGNYGVFYDVAVKLTNPTKSAAQPRIVFEPSAGMAGGIFLVSDGRKVEIPQTDMPTETTLTSVHLAPGETRTVTVRTLPLSGSNYPASLIVRP